MNLLHSFIDGIISIISFGQYPKSKLLDYPKILTPEEAAKADEEALRGDWEQVERDFQDAMQRL